MAYWEWGDPANDRVLVCVHGLTRQGRDFDVLARSLAQTYRVICPDIPGRGQSEWLTDPSGYAIPHYVADVVTLLARVNARTLDWVGTSMGGLIGMAVAGLPGSPIRRMVLNDVGPRMEAVALQRIGAYVGLPLRWPTVEAAAEYLRVVSAGFGPHSHEQWLALTRPYLKEDGQGGFVPRYDPQISLALKAMTPEIAQMGEQLLWQAYDRIQAQTLLLRGAQSDLLSVQTAQEMSMRGPKAPCVTFEGVGHAPTLVQDDQVGVVREFLLKA